jgi:hypothetical protein
MNTNTNRNINKRTCSTQPPGGPKPKHVTSQRFDDTETTSVTTSGDDTPPTDPIQLSSDAAFDEDSTTDRLCALHTMELLAERLKGASLPRQARALETLLRKKRVALAVQSTVHLIKEGEARALTLCLDDAKKYPEVVELFQKAFDALEQAREQS